MSKNIMRNMNKLDRAPPISQRVDSLQTEIGQLHFVRLTERNAIASMSSRMSSSVSPNKRKYEDIEAFQR